MKFKTLLIVVLQIILLLISGCGSGDSYDESKDREYLASKVPSFVSAKEVSFGENSVDIAYKARAVDGGEEKISYSLGDSYDEDLFTINSSSGDVRFKSPPNYEDPRGSSRDNKYYIGIIATNNYDKKAYIQVTINVTNLHSSYTEIYEAVGNKNSASSITYDNLNDLDGIYNTDWHDENMNLYRSIISVIPSNMLDSVSELKFIIDAANKVITLADKSDASYGLTKAEYNRIGLDVKDINLDDFNTLVAYKSKSEVDTREKLDTLLEYVLYPIVSIDDIDDPVTEGQDMNFTVRVASTLQEGASIDCSVINGETTADDFVGDIKDSITSFVDNEGIFSLKTKDDGIVENESVVKIRCDKPVKLRFGDITADHIFAIAKLKDISIPSKLTIQTEDTKELILSVLDSTPYTPAIDHQGVINNHISSNQVIFKLKYLVTGTTGVTLEAYSTSMFIEDDNLSQEGEKHVEFTLSWDRIESVAPGEGYINAKVTINDANSFNGGSHDNIYLPKKLDIQNNIDGVNLIAFEYPLFDEDRVGKATIKIVPPVEDQNFNVGSEHKFLYKPVYNQYTHKTWLGTNLGSNYNNINHSEFDLSKQAQGSGDYHAYGSLFQWGRIADSHELVDWIDAVSGDGNSTTTTDRSINLTPANSKFILAEDWLSSSADDGENGINNWGEERSLDWRRTLSDKPICPNGYVVPSKDDLEKEMDSWDSQDSSGAYASVLKLPLSGVRSEVDGDITLANQQATLWSSTRNHSFTSTYVLDIEDSSSNMEEQFFIARGHSVRCIKE